MKYLALCLSIISAFFLNACNEDDVSRRVVNSHFVTEASASDIIDLQLNNARERGVNAVLVFGAAWCHDSRGLENMMHNDARISTLLTDDFTVAYIDVGQHDTNLDQLARFGVHSLYGTPTVVIVDPVTMQVVNPNSVHDWRMAFKAAPSDVYAYFARYKHDRTRAVDIAPEVFGRPLAHITIEPLLAQWPAYNQALLTVEHDPSLTEDQRQAALAFIRASGRAFARAAMGDYWQASGEPITDASLIHNHTADLDRNGRVLTYLKAYDANLQPPTHIYEVGHSF
ncbi:thioredoxin family protein [Woodsholea maritima]|uniref:thioredoxin family protein n=1 Tax=Woodsholea maritima TaxID=240237 RepID=UPI0003727DA0|nr:thioredoxin family protein [Woodsholea maritima]